MSCRNVRPEDSLDQVEGSEHQQRCADGVEQIFPPALDRKIEDNDTDDTEANLARQSHRQCQGTEIEILLPVLSARVARGAALYPEIAGEEVEVDRLKEHEKRFAVGVAGIKEDVGADGSQQHGWDQHGRRDPPLESLVKEPKGTNGEEDGEELKQDEPITEQSDER